MSQFALKLTYTRLALIPLFIVLYFCESGLKWMSLTVYIIAALTDYLDGWYARKYQQTSKLGAFLDPVADKIMVVSVLIVLLYSHAQWWLMLCALIIIAREIWISALREWMASLQQRDKVKVSKIGKWKTALQMIALGMLIYQQNFLGLPIWHLGVILLIMATILALYSMYDYTYAARNSFKPE